MDDHTAIVVPTNSAIMPRGTDPDAAAPADWLRSNMVVPYSAAIERMRHIVTGIGHQRERETVWLLEHPPTYTAGTSAQPGDLLNPLGFETFSAGRGGQWTYHGPGQRIAYVMLDLHRSHGPVARQDVRAYVTALEGWLIAALASLGVEAGRRDGRVGVWVTDAASGREAKIAALGVRLTRWVTWHGVSINVDPDLSHFDGIVPCGIREHGVTSLRALGIDATLSDVDAALAACWPSSFGGEPPRIREA